MIFSFKVFAAHFCKSNDSLPRHRVRRIVSCCIMAANISYSQHKNWQNFLMHFFAEDCCWLANELYKHWCMIFLEVNRIFVKLDHLVVKKVTGFSMMDTVPIPNYKAWNWESQRSRGAECTKATTQTWLKISSDYLDTWFPPNARGQVVFLASW